MLQNSVSPVTNKKGRHSVAAFSKYIQILIYSLCLMFACAAARRAIGTLYGEQLT